MSFLDPSRSASTLHENLVSLRGHLHDPDELRQMELLLEETDPDLLAQSTLHLAHRYETSDHSSLSPALYELVGEDSEVRDSYRSEANDRLQVLAGQGDRWEQLGFYASRLMPTRSTFCDLAGMVVGGAAFSFLRYRTAMGLASSALAPVLGRTGVLGLAGAAGFVGEIFAFTAASRGMHTLLGEDLEWTREALNRELLGGALLMGSLRLSGLAGSALVQRTAGEGLGGRVARILVPQLAMLSGVMASERIEEELGWLPHRDISRRVMSALYSVANFNFANGLLRVTIGSHMDRWNRDMEQATEDLFPFDLGGSLAPAFAGAKGSFTNPMSLTDLVSGPIFSRGRNAGGPNVFPAYQELRKIDGRLMRLRPDQNAERGAIGDLLQSLMRHLGNEEMRIQWLALQTVGRHCELIPTSDHSRFLELTRGVLRQHLASDLGQSMKETARTLSRFPLEWRLAFAAEVARFHDPAAYYSFVHDETYRSFWEDTLFEATPRQRLHLALEMSTQENFAALELPLNYLNERGRGLVFHEVARYIESTLNRRSNFFEEKAFAVLWSYATVERGGTRRARINRAWELYGKLNHFSATQYHREAYQRVQDRLRKNLLPEDILHLLRFIENHPNTGRDRLTQPLHLFEEFGGLLPEPYLKRAVTVGLKHSTPEAFDSDLLGPNILANALRAYSGRLSQQEREQLLSIVGNFNRGLGWMGGVTDEYRFQLLANMVPHLSADQALPYDACLMVRPTEAARDYLSSRIRVLTETQRSRLIPELGKRLTTRNSNFLPAYQAIETFLPTLSPELRASHDEVLRRPAVLANLAWHLLQVRGHRTRALQLLRRALRADPDNLQIQEDLVKALTAR